MAVNMDPMMTMGLKFQLQYGLGLGRFVLRRFTFTTLVESDWVLPNCGASLSHLKRPFCASSSFPMCISSSSSSIGTATLVGFGLLNYRWVFSAGRFLQSARASGTSNPERGGTVIRTFQLPPPGVPHVWNDASEPQQRKVELWARKFPRILPKVATSASLLSSFTCSQFTTWDRRLYFPSGGRHAEDFLARKIRRLEPANVGTRGQHAYL